MRVWKSLGFLAAYIIVVAAFCVAGSVLNYVIEPVFVAAFLGLLLAAGGALVYVVWKGHRPQRSFEDAVAAYQRGDYATAMLLLRPLADEGDADAQRNLGYMYDNGRGVPQDDSAAVIWYRKAAVQGNTTAQVNLGFMYEKGRGVAQDDAAAVNWYRKSADQGNARAQCNLGYMYANGRGVPQDDAAA
jgi:hypothetical protein